MRDDDIRSAWAPTHRLHFEVPYVGQLDVMFVTSAIRGGRDGFTFLDRSDGMPEFSVTEDGEWRRDGRPFVGRIEVLRYAQSPRPAA
jgi:hypothetical protein